MRNRLLLCVLLFCGFYNYSSAKNTSLYSPNKRLKVDIDISNQIKYSIDYNNTKVITPSAISMTLYDGKILGVNDKIKRISRKSVKQDINTIVYRKSIVHNEYNQLILFFKDYSIEFRAFDFGVGYRFNLSLGDKEIIVKDEKSEYNFADDYNAFYSYSNHHGTIEDQFSNSFENLYNNTTLTKIDNKSLIFLPMMVELPNNIKACISEVNLFSYPGMFLQNFNSKNGVSSIFSTYPKTLKQGGHNNLQMIVKARENYIAKINGNRNMPWRAIAITPDDKAMADNDLVYCLADECQLKDTSWIKPGKVAWDWWNDWNISNIDFKAGINNETYKYYIDFASKYGIEYVILDEGWAVNREADMMKVIPEIDLKYLIDYAKSKNVGIILWGGYKALDKDMENVCKHYADMGVKGFKVDFMDRDDQIIVDFYERMARTAAKYKLMVDFHGAFKPSGLNRTLPNVINYEGVHGLEQMKWSPNSVDQVTYDVTLPFIRQFAGPMDYTQGAMRNANRSNYYPCNSEPMSQGTRCHQLAEYIVFESPLNMLCDSPTEYEKEPVYTKFLASIPTTWDETKMIDGKVAEYIVTARRKGNDWYIGGLTNWNSRDVTIDLSFIKDIDKCNIETFTDGINSEKKASDYKHKISSKVKENKMNIHLSSGGGFLVKVSKI